MNYVISILLLFLLVVVSVISYKKIRVLINIVYKYEKIIDEQGKKNHEYNNQLLVLLGYIDNKQKLREYLYTIIDDHRTGQNYEIRQLSNMPKGGIKRLLYYKLNKMKTNNIDCSLYITEDAGLMIEKLDLKKYKDLTKILGVLLDNSLDAAKKSKDKEIFLDFKENDNKLNILISNTYDNELPIKKVGKKHFTTKGVGHGYGLLLVNDICKNNSDISLESNFDKDMFKQEIFVEV